MTSTTADDAGAAPDPKRAGDRYEIQSLLGRGGMACVYRATDRATGKEVALKQLLVAPGATNQSGMAALFEREFHTLAQLRHPQVIAVYDYGLLADGSPFYTMELLDGGDLRERAPLPWREACRLLFDVCSSLALLHSRRLLHRDVSPRNIRCTRDGRAKLIDFGAMTAISAGGADVVGTPAFVAPETLHRLALDARTDLYSLGASLYFALTGNVPYPAHTFAAVMTAWGGRVRPPSALVADIPAALDDLVLSLISLEPDRRPQSAFHVMQLLAAIGGVSSAESDAVSLAYLVTPALVGRTDALEHFRRNLMASHMSRGGSLVIEGKTGVGRSRLLDACVLEAKTLGFSAMRATATGAQTALSIARALTDHLLEALPSAATSAPELFETPPPSAADPKPLLRDFHDAKLDAQHLQQALCRLWLGASRSKPLLIAVDDVHRIDPESAAVLAALMDSSKRGRVFVILSADTDEPPSPASTALSRRCTALPLEPLAREQTHALLGSLFGDVANLDMLANEVHDVAQGNPRLCMDMAQHLVDRGLVRYASGGWTLPSRLSTEDLPRGPAAAVQARLQRLSGLSHTLAEALALAIVGCMSDREFRALLPDESTQHIEQALSELLSNGVLIGTEAAYTLPNGLWTAELVSALEPDALAQRHRSLARLYEPRSKIAFIYHAFAGGLEEQGLTALAELNAGYGANKIDYAEAMDQGVGKMMACYPRAFASAARLGKSPRFVNELRRWNYTGRTVVDDPSYPDSAREWLAQLEHDSGLDLYRANIATPDAMQRLTMALTGAQERYLATPEAERVYGVEEALRLLAEYVVISIVIGGRSADAALLRTLPPLLEPFVALSPVLDAIWDNARATYIGTGEGQYESARVLWLATLTKLDALDGNELPYVAAIADAVAYAIGMMEAQLGLPSASSWADRVERDPYQKVGALQLRTIVKLEQGDWKAAERFRRQAEVLALRSRAPQMFKLMLTVELSACTSACDLVGIQDVIERMRPLAATCPPWQPNLLLAEASFHLVRGDFEMAKSKCDACIAMTRLDEQRFSLNILAWFAAHALLAEALLGLNRAQDARAVARSALEVADAWYPGTPTVELVRMLALAEAMLGERAAVERLDASIAQQAQLGVTGVRLGLSYETRARIAIWQADAKAFNQYAELTAREYRYGAGSTLGTRYDKLLNEAARRGMHTQAALADFATLDAADSSQFSEFSRRVVDRSMAHSQRVDERSRNALQLICSLCHARTGQLYLLSPTSFVLAAMQGEAVPLQDLDVLSDFVARARERSAELDEMATGDLADEEGPRAFVTAGACRYELLLLSSVVAGVSTIAAVAAVVRDDDDFDALRQRQLLEALAPHLLGGDTALA